MTSVVDDAARVETASVQSLMAGQRHGGPTSPPWRIAWDWRVHVRRHMIRWRGLGAHASYTCSFPYRVVYQEDLDAGHFTPVTEWTSTSDDTVTVTVVRHTGRRVELS
ncbi:hypothetical protein [Streptomyces sp. NPDC001292]|uniref:hypothetical protein n=1 Tax=Streptomyces sp. NPDC001292 TaxID=3364558 RepID=UPI0036AB00CB